MPNVNITVADDSPIAAFLAAIEISQESKLTLMNDIGRYFVRSTHQRIVNEVTPSGTPWKKSIRARATGGATLRETNKLFNSVTYGVLSPDLLEYGTDVGYGIPLHFGQTVRAVAAEFLAFYIPGVGWAKRRSVTLEARPWLGVDTQDELAVIDIFTHFLEKVGDR